CFLLDMTHDSHMLQPSIGLFGGVGLIQAKMLWLQLRSLDEHARGEQWLESLDVVTVGSRDMYRQRYTTPVNQQMALSAQFTPIDRVGTGLLASKRRWDHLAVGCLPLPGDTAHPIVPGEHHADNSLKQPRPRPLLEAPMHGRTGAVL